MVHDITLDKASLVSLSVEAILYGGYAVLFGLCVYVLLKRRTKGAANKPYLIAAILAFILNTGHITVGIIRALQAFSDEGSSNSAIDYYNQPWLPLDIIKQVLMVTTTLVADVMVTYHRCYLVWSCQWTVMVAPVILVATSAVTAFVSVYKISQLEPGKPLLNSEIVSWGDATFVLWLVTIVLLTSLIVYRLQFIARQTREFLGKERGNRYNYITIVILESGIIYAISALVMVILCVMRSAYEVVASDAISQITGITATLIIVRIGLETITEGKPTEHGSRTTHTSLGKPRHVSIFNIHTSGSDLESMGTSESAGQGDHKVV